MVPLRTRPGLVGRWRARWADRRSRAAARRWLHDGSEPRWARSDLPARRLLAGIAAPLCVLGAAGFALLAATAGSGPEARATRTFDIVVAAVCAVAAVAAVVDLFVIRRRMAEQRRWQRR